MTRHRARLFSVGAAIACLVAGCGDDHPAAPPAPPPPAASPAAAEFAALVNAHRAAQGLAPLAWDPAIAAVAQAHSEDMVAREFFSHTNPDGESPFDRLAAAGFSYSAAGENIAYGYPTAESVLAAWLASDGHRANIEHAGYTHHGVGLAGTHWTHVFVRGPSSARPVPGTRPATAVAGPPPLSPRPRARI